MRECDAAIANSCGAILDVFGAAPERTDLSRYRCRRKRLRLWSAAIRSRHRDIKRLPFKRQAEIALDQIMRCVEPAGHPWTVS
jgi:hypothetical protein